MKHIPAAFNSYWGVFLTLQCNFTCSFCIQKLAGPIPHYELKSGKEWVRALNGIEGRSRPRFLRRAKIKKLALIGGEPTLHPDFFEIVNGLDNNWSVTVTTNLGSPVFKDISFFAGKIKRRPRLRVHPSFHDNNIAAPDFIKRVKALRKQGLVVNRVFTVCYPPDNPALFKEYSEAFRKEGLFLERQRYNGYYQGHLYPFEGDESQYEFKDNIRDYAAYKQACAQECRKDIHCKMNKVLFAPDGSIYNCHYKVYNKTADSYGNIFSSDVPSSIPQGYFLCHDYGFCNPCDWPYAKFKV